MTGFLRSRHAIGLLIAVVAIHIVLGVATFGPSTTADPSDIPVAVLDNDTGSLRDRLIASDLDLIDWRTAGNRDEVTQQLDNREIAAALVIPDGTSRALDDLATQPVEPVVLELLVSSGRSPRAAEMVQAAVVALVNGASAQISGQLLTGATAAGAGVNPASVPALADPLRVEVTAVNAPTDAADAQTPLVLVAMLWIGALIATLIAFLSLHRSGITAAGFVGAQLIIGAALAVLQPLSIVAVGNWALGLEISLSWGLYGALALTTVMFFLLQSSVLNWLGFGGWPILVLLWLFSFTMLAQPAESLATGYRVLVHSWLPARFPYEGIQGIIHFDGAGRAVLMMGVTGAIAAGALTALVASFLRLARRDLSANPLVRRVLATHGDQVSPTVSAPSEAPVSAQPTSCSGAREAGIRDDHSPL